MVPALMIEADDMVGYRAPAKTNTTGSFFVAVHAVRLVLLAAWQLAAVSRLLCPRTLQALPSGVFSSFSFLTSARCPCRPRTKLSLPSFYVFANPGAASLEHSGLRGPAAGGAHPDVQHSSFSSEIFELLHIQQLLSSCG